MQPFDQVRFDAFARLLAQPDPSDLPRRVSLSRCEGDLDRQLKCLPVILMAAWDRKHHERAVDHVPRELARAATY